MSHNLMLRATGKNATGTLKETDVEWLDQVANAMVSRSSEIDDEEDLVDLHEAIVIIRRVVDRKLMDNLQWALAVTMGYACEGDES